MNKVDTLLIFNLFYVHKLNHFCQLNLMQTKKEYFIFECFLFVIF